MLLRTTPLFAALVCACAGDSAREEGDVATDSHVEHGAAVVNTEPREITIASFNVLYALADDDPDKGVDPETLARIEALDVDVLLLQETNAAWEKAIIAAVGDRYRACKFHQPKRYLPEGLGACSKAGIREDLLIPSPVAWFPAQRLVAETPSGPIQLVNVHLRPAVANADDWMRIHVETRADRKKEVAAYVSELAPDTPTIIAGDFNERPEGDLFGLLREHRFDSALPAAHVDKVTWRWAGTTPPLEHQLDHIAFETDAFELVSADVRPGGHSDHDAVVVTLRRK
ncbi:MAG: hypothetical protein HOW73_02300 [Polyangiaceae bacterium]|nr:hypothetical protein [Polyangiaceae bacterium]